MEEFKEGDMVVAGPAFHEATKDGRVIPGKVYWVSRNGEGSLIVRAESWPESPDSDEEDGIWYALTPGTWWLPAFRHVD